MYSMFEAANRVEARSAVAEPPKRAKRTATKPPRKAA